MKTDIAIIGGGIVGCAAAYFLAKKGYQPLVIEKDPGVGLQASGRNGGGVRQHGRKAILPLAIESVKLWGTLKQELGADLEYYRTGNLKIAMDEATMESCERDLAYEHDHGLGEVRMLTAAECREMVPGINGPVLGGKFCPTDGIANPMLPTPAFARAGAKLGVKFLMNTAVTGLLRQGSRVCGVKTSGEEIEAQVVINAAGPWAAALNAEAGCPTVIGPGRSQLLITERLRQIPIKCWVTLSGFGYIRPTCSNNLVIGSAGTRNDDYRYNLNYHQSAIQSVLLSRYLPWFKDIQIIRGCAGITEYTPDSQPYIGALPGVPGMVVAAGFNGEGFCPGPMVGKILAEMISGEEPAVSLEPFRPDRFNLMAKNGKPVPPVQYSFDKMFPGWISALNLPDQSLAY